MELKRNRTKVWRPTKCAPPEKTKRRTVKGCEFFDVCSGLSKDPNVIGVGCEVVSFDERPDQYEPSDVYYSTTSIHHVAIGVFRLDEFEIKTRMYDEQPDDNADEFFARDSQLILVYS